MNRFHLCLIFLPKAEWPLFLQGHSIAVSGDAGSYVLIKKIALISHVIMHPPSPMHSWERTTFTISPMTSRQFELLPGLTQYLQPRQSNGVYFRVVSFDKGSSGSLGRFSFNGIPHGVAFYPPVRIPTLR
jgi:hypothetical protein